MVASSQKSWWEECGAISFLAAEILQAEASEIKNEIGRAEGGLSSADGHRMAKTKIWPHAKPVANSVQEQIPKACKVNAKLAPGLHYESCAFDMVHLKSTAGKIAHDSFGLEEQLRTTTMTLDQRQNALHHTFVP